MHRENTMHREPRASAPTRLSATAFYPQGFTPMDKTLFVDPSFTRVERKYTPAEATRSIGQRAFALPIRPAHMMQSRHDWHRGETHDAHGSRHHDLRPHHR